MVDPSSAVFDMEVYGAPYVDMYGYRAADEFRLPSTYFKPAAWVDFSPECPDGINIEPFRFDINNTYAIAKARLVCEPMTDPANGENLTRSTVTLEKLSRVFGFQRYQLQFLILEV